MVDVEQRARHPQTAPHSATHGAPRGDARLPLVSIVVPVYNGAKFVGETLDSLLAQRYPNVEIIVIDDASTDGTPEVLGAYEAHVRLVTQQENRGIYATMNHGIALARGEFVAIYHADDVYLPEIVERQVAFLTAHPEAGAVFCQDIFVDAEGTEYGRLNIPDAVRGEKPLDYAAILNAELTYKNTFLVCPSCMVRKAVYDAVGGYDHETYFNTSDLEMYLRIAREYPIGILEDHLMRYRHGHGNSSQKYHHLRTDPNRFFRIVDRYLEQGGRALVTRWALRHYEAHRAEDNLMCAISAYVMKDLDLARERLARVRAGTLLRSDKVQRYRLVILVALMRLLVRLPHSARMAGVFYRRWHDR